MLNLEGWIEVKDLHRQGHSIRQICRLTGYSRNSVRKFCAGAFGAWGEVFAGDAVTASAALDRLLHRCTIVNIRGDSYRLKEKRQADSGGYAKEVAGVTSAA